MKLWLNRLEKPVPDGMKSPAELARWELENTFPDESFTLEETPGSGDSWTIEPRECGFRLTGSAAGLLYAAYRLITGKLCGESFEVPLSSSPKYALRMVDCWDNPDGSIERGYSGRSLFFRDNRLSYDPARLRELGRLLASACLNVLCINNVNVKYPAQLLLEENLPELAALADLFRPFGVRLMVSVDFSQPLRRDLPTSDPLDPAVRNWWKQTAERVWAAVPDLAGFLVKADSEGQPGPYAYGRNHADGANMLAEALAPFGGKVVWRCFVYNCKQDWRDTKTDRPKAAYDTYMPLDGSFADNVILQVKYGPFDFQVREPLSPLLLGMRHTSLAMELQLAQEYTGHQIDLFTMIPMWKELFEELPEDNISAIAAVSNLGNDEICTGHPLAAVNLYTYGLLAWDPGIGAREAVTRWVRLSWHFPEEQEKALVELLLSSRRVYEQYTAPLGLCWMVNPHDHYGPNPSGYEYDLWGTYHKANRDAVGIDRTAAGTGYLLQYPETLQKKYGDPCTCPELYLLFFHRLPYGFVMQDGRTLIQRIYDDHFEGAEKAEKMSAVLASLPFPEPEAGIIRKRMELQLKDAREWRDVINTFFFRLSGVPDAHGRKIYD